MRRNSNSVRRARPLLGTLVDIRIADDSLPALERAFATIQRVHRAMSAQDSTSDIARLRAGRCALDPWTRQVLERAEEIRLATDGLFDWRAGGYSLDGIAKGFAVDRAVECLRDAGVAGGVVNAGGDLRVFGSWFEDVHVRPPRSPEVLRCIGSVREAAVATSGCAGLVEPRAVSRRMPASGVTVIAPDCMTADALTKPCLLDPQRAGELAARLGARALVL